MCSPIATAIFIGHPSLVLLGRFAFTITEFGNLAKNHYFMSNGCQFVTVTLVSFVLNCVWPAPRMCRFYQKIVYLWYNISTLRVEVPTSACNHKIAQQIFCRGLMPFLEKNPYWYMKNTQYVNWYEGKKDTHPSYMKAKALQLRDSLDLRISHCWAHSLLSKTDTMEVMADGTIL